MGERVRGQPARVGGVRVEEARGGGAEPPAYPGGPRRLVGQGYSSYQHPVPEGQRKGGGGILMGDGGRGEGERLLFFWLDVVGCLEMDSCAGYSLVVGCMGGTQVLYRSRCELEQLFCRFYSGSSPKTSFAQADEVLACRRRKIPSRIAQATIQYTNKA